MATAHKGGNGEPQLAFLAHDDSLDVADDPLCYDFWFFHELTPYPFNAKCTPKVPVAVG
jgi:hypothetical protein